jgi:hypothetical protein
LQGEQREGDEQIFRRAGPSERRRCVSHQLRG